MLKARFRRNCKPPTKRKKSGDADLIFGIEVSDDIRLTDGKRSSPNKFEVREMGTAYRANRSR